MYIIYCGHLFFQANMPFILSYDMVTSVFTHSRVMEDEPNLRDLFRYKLLYWRLQNAGWFMYRMPKYWTMLVFRQAAPVRCLTYIIIQAYFVV